MTDSDSASRQLRVIRSLMERATIYRSLSAPTALVGGLLSFGGFATAYYAKHHRHQSLSPGEFLMVWLVILALTLLTAGMLTFLIHRPIHLALLWITLYGMALLATQHFAPRSLVVLGGFFFLTGCVLM